MAEKVDLGYLEWQALIVLYRNKERISSPMRYVGFKETITALIKHHPPLAAWVGKPSESQVHITTEGIAFYEGGA